MFRNRIGLLGLLAVAIIFTGCSKNNATPTSPAPLAVSSPAPVPATKIPAALAAKVQAPAVHTLGGIPHTIKYEVDFPGNALTPVGIFYYTDSGWQYLTATSSWTQTITLANVTTPALYIYTINGQNLRYIYAYVNDNQKNIGYNSTSNCNWYWYLTSIQSPVSGPTPTITPTFTRTATPGVPFTVTATQTNTVTTTVTPTVTATITAAP
jgi:hypothetical protein